MTPIINPTWNPATQAAHIWMHPNVEDGTYIAKKEDKFVLWRNYEELEELLKYIKFHISAPTDFSTQQWSNLIENYIGFRNQHLQTPPCQIVQSAVDGVTYNTKVRIFTPKTPPCQIVPSAVDGVTYNTKIRIFTPNVPYTHLGRSWYPELHLHMYVYNDGPHHHPVYGEHIGWTAAVIMVN
jgi:hypothetical protein